MDDRDLEAIEWHDGTLETISVSPGTLVFKFSECFVYRKRAPEIYDVETCESRLALLNLVELRIVGVIDSEAEVSDCTILSEQDPMSLSDLLAGSRSGHLELVLTNSSTVHATFGSARLELIPPYTFLEIWEGPLVSDD